MKKRNLLTTFFILALSAPMLQANSYIRQNYINTYREIAIQEMYRSGIPASITLAQGILESMWGQGTLAIKSNNHFGIKCKQEWKGEGYKYYDDDYDANGNKIKSCFRVYSSPQESYRDHTDFLINRERYQKLFTYHATDYVNWAKGLKQCGYATDPMYAQKLIRIIEENQLYQFDLSAINNPIGNPTISQQDAATYVIQEETLPADYQVVINVVEEDTGDFLPFEFTMENGKPTVNTVQTNANAGITIGHPGNNDRLVASAYNEELYVETIATPEKDLYIPAPVRIEKPIISRSARMGNAMIMKAPRYSYRNAALSTTTYHKPVRSQPVFEYQAQGTMSKPIFRQPKRKERQVQAERGVKLGNMNLR